MTACWRRNRELNEMFRLLDRYLLRNFVRMFCISLFVFSAMFVIVDAFNNLEEFIEYGKEGGGVLVVVYKYYRVHVLPMVDMLSPLLVLLAAILTLTTMKRAQEMTAIMAAGVAPLRVVRPLLMAGVAVSLLGVANREMVVPRFRDELSRNAQNWLGEQAFPVEARYDHQTNIYINGEKSYANEKRISAPSFRLPSSMHQFARQLHARDAFYQRAETDRPGGYLLRGVTSPQDLDSREPVVVAGQPVILTSRGTDWLSPRECFVVSEVGFHQLAAGESWRSYASSRELVKGLHNPSLDFGADVRFAIHSRFVRPLLDVILLCLVLPIVLARRNANPFKIAFKCFLLVVGFRIVLIGCEHLGGNYYLLSPALAAWLPAMVFAPIAMWSMHSLWE
ncbi:MAG: LptF/LptG family permease [Pirellulaceae bacterium]|jgi:lipopolysaccharide export system permease protein|nr:LptF/LptG family permease [Pirellulaceae bacterium]MDP7016666.1 LptF/LptG family permease [Pirellulaceae bacterium]